MTLKETLKSDLTEAIRSSDKVVSGTIRMVLTAITNEEVSGKEARVLTDAEIITVLSREAKKRRESAEAYTQAQRPELAQQETDELAVLDRGRGLLAIGHADPVLGKGERHGRAAFAGDRQRRVILAGNLDQRHFLHP